MRFPRIGDSGRSRLTGVLAAVALWMAATGVVANPGSAQTTSDLDAVERLLAAGRTEEARQALSRWREASGDEAVLVDRARGWYLAGRLSEDARRAELYYLKVVVEGSISPYADDALLRLAQYRVAQGQYPRAIDYLERLQRDYPGSELAGESLLWLARAARSNGDDGRACGAAEEGLRQVHPADTAVSRALREAQDACTAGGGGYSIQVAALQDRDSAEGLVEGLRAAGYEAWILEGSGDSLHRVRVGRGLEISEAQQQVERLIAAGYSPFIVGGASGSGGGG